MDTGQHPNAEQAALWNGPGANAWIGAQEVLGDVLRPFENMLVEAVGASSTHHVLDVGCGTGDTTLAIARVLARNDCCVGIDISEPMITVARTRAEREGSIARFIGADVQTYTFEPTSFDMIVSRFGVMFFDDPVRAFANLRHAATDGAELRCLAWRTPAENPFMTTAERAASPLLNVPAREPDAPGQFAFADPRRVASILEKSGWARIELQPVDVQCVFAESELIGYFTRLGPLGRLLLELDEPTRARVVATVRAAFDPYVQGDLVRFDAACWMITARC